MANFIISPYAISFNSIKNALQAYINDKNVSSVLDTWSDFYTAGAGQTIVELDAAVASFYAFHFIIGRREAYLPVAQNYNSILGGAESLGYSASRGRNVRVAITMIPLQTQTLTKWSVIGSYGEYDIVLMETVTVTKDKEVVLNCVIGNSAVQSITITSSEVQQFTYTAEDTTDDVRLILNDIEVPIATTLEEAMDDKYIILSNSYGSVDVFYLNQGGRHVSYNVMSGSINAWTQIKGNQGDVALSTIKLYKDIAQSASVVNDGTFVYTGATYISNYTYSVQDVLYLQYIQRNNLKYSALSLSSIELDCGSVVDMSMISDYEDKQSKDSIRFAASVYHETSNVVRARKDFAKFLLEKNELNLIDTNDRDINPGLMAVTYLRTPDAEGNTKLTTAEKERFMESVVAKCPDAVPNIFIEDPIAVSRTLDITLSQKVNETIPTDIDDYITEILESYEGKLETSLDLAEVEHKLERIAGVKTARVDIGTREYALDTKYKLYDIVLVKDVLLGNDYEDWLMMCVKVQTKAGENEPDWGSAVRYGDTVVDSNLVWERANKYISSVPYRWKANGDFSMYSDVAVGYNIYPNCTSYTQPSWGGLAVVDGNVTFNKVKTYDYLLRGWAKNTRFAEEEYVLFSSGNKRVVYKVAELLHNTGTSIPSWSSAENISDNVYDGAVTWTLTHKGYSKSENYLAGDSIGIVSGTKIYAYTSAGAVTSETKYANAAGTAEETSSPFDGREQIYTWVEKTIIDEETGEETTVWSKGSIIWVLDETLDYTEWQSYTAMPLLCFTKGNNNIFQATNISNSTTGENWFDVLDTFPDTYVDNNIKWVKDTYNLSVQTYPVDGITWIGAREYSLNELVVVTDGIYHYVYNIVHLNNHMITTNNVIYTVATYNGVTGITEPTWTHIQNIGGEDVEVGYNNVEDNEILWTKTTDAGTQVWSANTRFDIGTIISTDGGYYVFSSVLGTTGSDKPDWSGINNGLVEDNNITWQKIEKTPILNLAWNEHLKLDYILEPIS